MKKNLSVLFLILFFGCLSMPLSIYAADEPSPPKAEAPEEPLSAPTKPTPSASEAKEDIQTSPAFTKKDGVRLVYLTLRPSFEKDQEFVKKVKQLFDSCSVCDYQIFSVAKANGTLDIPLFMDRLKNLPEKTRMVVLDFNEKASGATKQISDQIQKIQDQDILVMASSGHAPEGQIPMLLKKTFLGQNANIIIIGELSDRERMWPQSHYGPEIYTALRLPSEFSGADFAGIYGASKILPRLQKRKGKEYLELLLVKKAKSKKIWLDSDDLVY